MPEEWSKVLLSYQVNLLCFFYQCNYSHNCCSKVQFNHNISPVFFLVYTAINYNIVGIVVTGLAQFLLDGKPLGAKDL